MCSTCPLPVLHSGSVCPQRSRLSHLSLASQHQIAARRSLGGLQEGPPSVGTWNSILEVTIGGPATTAPTLGRKEDRVQGTSCPISRQLKCPQSGVTSQSGSGGRASFSTAHMVIRYTYSLCDPGYLPILSLGTPAGR